VFKRVTISLVNEERLLIFINLIKDCTMKKQVTANQLKQKTGGCKVRIRGTHPKHKTK
jgi:RNA-binding protein YhbY